MFWFFSCEALGILAPQPGVEPSPPTLEGEVLTTGLPGKSQDLFCFVFHKTSLLEDTILDTLDVAAFRFCTNSVTDVINQHI